MVETVRVVEARGRVVRLFGSGDSLFRKAALRDRCDRHFLHSDYDPRRGNGNGVERFCEREKSGERSGQMHRDTKGGKPFTVFRLGVC